ncbi:hypothetical protein NC651_022562 [Populus alba x Populus x berolinensis]|nr:hypothetical protein NC651_022562 [Populus alba x Populus x berolinensis]
MAVNPLIDRFSRAQVDYTKKHDRWIAATMAVVYFHRIPRSKRCRFHSSARSPNRSSVTVALSTVANSVPARSEIHTVGDFMTKREDLHVLKANTTVDDALEALVEKRITGFPVIDDDWKLVGVVSDYDLLVLGSISGSCQNDTNLFPDVDSSWKQTDYDCFFVRLRSLGVGAKSFQHCSCPYHSYESKSLDETRDWIGSIRQFDLLSLPSLLFKDTAYNQGMLSTSSCTRACSQLVINSYCRETFNELQKLLIKNNGKVVGDLMTPNPLVVYETTNLEDAVRLLLETKYRRLPVVDNDGKLVGIITRGDIVRASQQIKSSTERST